MRSNSGRVSSTALLLLCLALPAAAQPHLTLGPDSITLEGATPLGLVAWQAVARVPLGFHQRVQTLRVTTRADGEGRTAIALNDLGYEETGVPPKSVWSAVDVTTGEWAVEAPELLRRAGFSEPAGRAGVDEAERLPHPHRTVEALLVRPGNPETGAGAWGLRLTDGSPADGDGGFDGAVELEAPTLLALDAEQPAPERYQVGDVLVLIDPDRLEISAGQLEEDGIREGGER